MTYRVPAAAPASSLPEERRGPVVGRICKSCGSIYARWAGCHRGKPVYGKDQLFFDIWFKYQKKINVGNSRLDWTLYVKIANPFESSPSVVPYEASFQLDGAYSKYQVEADRRITISNKIAF